jgi:hypothetical protein
MAIIACSLIIYAVGVVTDFFANPIFSMFFIVSQETARNIFTYLAAGIAITLIIIASSLVFIQKRKSTIMKKPENEANPERIVKLNPSINDQKITTYFESNNPKNQSDKQKPIKQLTRQSRTQMTTRSNADEVAMDSQEALNQGKILCSICKETFKVPLYQIDTSSSKVELVRICPYCRQSLDSQPENAIDDWWVRMFNTQTVQ